MAETTGISWTDSTFNPWIGCAKVSPGCDHCYAEISTPSRTMRIVWGPQEQRKRTSAGNWKLPLRWNAAHADFYAVQGRRRRVFCASLADVFDNQVDPAWRDELWNLVRATPNLDWLMLTKRIGNVKAMLPDDWHDGYANVWLGISVVNQKEADRDIPKLHATPAHLRWLSMEPLLGPVNLEGVCRPWGEIGPSAAMLSKINWVVVGGESGPHARIMPEEWAQDLGEQCNRRGVPFYFKQHGGTAKDKGGCLLRGVEAKTWPIAA